MELKEFEQFLNLITSDFLPVIDAEISKEEYVLMDISKDNRSLENFDVSSSKEWENYINVYLNKNNAKVAFGGYLERRNIYNRSTYFKNQSKEKQRNIHLGIDLWCNKNTKVLAALNGEIHSFKFNKNHGDYGPTIILKHQIKGETFYTLYGHLSALSLENINVGDAVLKGDVIGFLGDASVNGDYAPHLHFQIIRDLEENYGDYPGVSSEENLEFYKKNCANPNLLLKITI